MFDASSPASALPGVSSLGTLPYQPQGRGGLVQAASVEQQASGSMAGLLGAPETSRRLLAGRVRAPRLSSHSALPGIWGVSQEQPVITWGGCRHPMLWGRASLQGPQCLPEKAPPLLSSP